MKKNFIWCFIFFLSFSFLKTNASDVHVVMETSRIYMDHEQKRTYEFWFTDKKEYRKVGDVILITREDLGLTWIINLERGTYFERKIKKPAEKPAEKPAKERKVDVHTLGYDYEPKYEWRIKETGETKEIDGFPCRFFIAEGDADFSEISAKYWICTESDIPGGAEFNALLIKLYKDNVERKPILDILKKYKNSFPVIREEVTEKSIAPTIRVEVKLTKLEKREAPSNIYEVPEDIKAAKKAAKKAPKKEKFELPSAVLSELKRVEETYHVLNCVAEKVWPGWTNYKDFPFLLKFENGLRVLIDHPNPPKGYESLPGIKVADKDVYVDKRNISSLELKEPLSCGGGIISYGTTPDGKRVSTVDMSFRKITPKDEEGQEEFKTESRILTYIHELFHCFQRDNVRMQYGNFRFNPDTSYAVYSEIEGMAIDKAYHESSDERAREYLKDFIVARNLKRKNMSKGHQNREASDEVREGTAVYSEVRILEIIKEGFKPRLTSEEDSYYGGFEEVDSLMKQYADRLRENSRETYDSLGKRYIYGCVQGLLLQRLFPGWQQPFSKKACFLDKEIKKRIPVSEEESTQIQKRFQKIYRIDEIKKRHQKAIQERDDAYKLITSRKGKSYIVSFKNIKEFVSRQIDKDKKSFNLGLVYVYPEGVGTLRFDDIELTADIVPTEVNQLYYLKWIDTDWEKREKPFSLKFENKEAEDVFKDVVIKTPLFTLKAPKLRIKERGDMVKMWILSRVKEE